MTSTGTVDTGKQQNRNTYVHILGIPHIKYSPGTLLKEREIEKERQRQRETLGTWV
jgi:hypothetical protein